MEEAHYRYGTHISITPLQHIRFLLEQVLTGMITDAKTGFLPKPMELAELEREQTWVHDKYLTVIEVCRALDTDEEKRAMAFTRCLLLSARLWRMAALHRDEFSMNRYSDLSVIMFVSFNYTLPKIQCENKDADLLELYASDVEEEMALASSDQKQPNEADSEDAAEELRELLESLKTASPDVSLMECEPVQSNTGELINGQQESNTTDVGGSDMGGEELEKPDLRQFLNQRQELRGLTRGGGRERRTRNKCYNCRQRGHYAAQCTNPRVVVARPATMAGSGAETAQIPQGMTQL